jgi:hypothetical protein
LTLLLPLYEDLLRRKHSIQCGWEAGIDGHLQNYLGDLLTSAANVENLEIRGKITAKKQFAVLSGHRPKSRRTNSLTLKPFRAVVRSQFAKISSWLCSAHPTEALAQLLCEKSRLLKGGEVVAVL